MAEEDALTTSVVCPNDNGLASSFYSIDFTAVKDVPSDWTLATDEKVTFGPAGAAFSFEKRFDSPTMRTNFDFFFGHVEYVMKPAPGTGIVSSMVLLSDDLDEVDWEFRGSIADSVQTNYFGKGFTGTYNRSTTVPLAFNPQTGLHTYALDWSPDSLVWSIDGKVVRTLTAAEAGSQYPQTPMKVSLSLWDGGDKDTNPGTVQWAGGYTPLPPPDKYTMYVHSVKIWNHNPAQQYQYTDKSGSWKSIKALNTTITSNSSKTMSQTAKSSSASATLSSTKKSGNATLSMTKSYSNSSSIASATTTKAQNSSITALHPGSTVAAYTTKVVVTTLTTCPITNTITSGSTTRTQITTTVSTITSTSTSTVCTRCVPPTSVSSLSSTKCNSTVTSETPKISTSGPAWSVLYRNTTSLVSSPTQSYKGTPSFDNVVTSTSSLPSSPSSASKESASNSLASSVSVSYNSAATASSASYNVSSSSCLSTQTTSALPSLSQGTVAAGSSTPCSTTSVGASTSLAAQQSYPASQASAGTYNMPADTPNMSTSSSLSQAVVPTTYSQAKSATAPSSSAFNQPGVASACSTCAASTSSPPPSPSMAQQSSISAVSSSASSMPDFPQYVSSGSQPTGDANSPVASYSATVASCSICGLAAPFSSLSAYAASSSPAAYPTSASGTPVVPGSPSPDITAATGSSDAQLTGDMGDSVTDIEPSSTSTIEIESTSTQFLTQTITATMSSLPTTVPYPVYNSSSVYASGSMVSVLATGTGTATGTGYYQPTSSPITYSSSGTMVGLNRNVAVAVVVAGTMAALQFLL